WAWASSNGCSALARSRGSWAGPAAAVSHAPSPSLSRCRSPRTTCCATSPARRGCGGAPTSRSSCCASRGPRSPTDWASAPSCSASCPGERNPVMLMKSRARRRSAPARPAAQHAGAEGPPLRVLLPRGLAALARESGIGAAIRHQEKAVRALGHEVVTDPLGPFDVVHLNTPFPDTLLLALWARLRRRPTLVWAHSTEDDFRASFPGSNRLAPLFRRWIALLYRRGDTVVTPSEYSAQLISAPKYGLRAPIRVLSNGVDTRFFRPDPSARERLRDALGLPPE